jgi:hypothetical protein
MAFGPAIAEEIKCPSISAKTHYHSSSTASATESGGSCTVSVDNADADSHGFPPETIWCLGRGFRNNVIDLQMQAGQLTPDQLGNIVALIAATSSDAGAGLDGGGFVGLDSMANCDGFLSGLGGLGDGTMSSGISMQTDQGLGDAVANCIFGGSASFPVEACEVTSTTAQITFSSGFGQHVVAVPR